MRNLYIIFIFLMARCLLSCSNETQEFYEEKDGTIYGIVTDQETSEPLRGVAVNLYALKENISDTQHMYDLITSSTTYDDGHFEFKNLTPNTYKINLSLDGYDSKSYEVKVDDDKMSKIDISLKKNIIVITNTATIGNGYFENLGYCDYIGLKGTLICSVMDEPECFGFYYGKDPNPQKNGTRVEANIYSHADTSFEINRTYKYELIKPDNAGIYYYQAFVINQKGTFWGKVLSFTVE